jgi:hypothetical protein
MKYEKDGEQLFDAFYRIKPQSSTDVWNSNYHIMDYGREIGMYKPEVITEGLVV